MKKEPLYQRIYHDLLEAVRSQAYPPGSKLPSENEVAAKYKVSRITCKKAFGLLAQQGIISRKPGKGSFVLKAPLPPPGRFPLQAIPDRCSRSIGVVMEGLGPSFGAEILLGIEAQCLDLGLNVVFKCTHGDQRIEARALQDLMELGVAGIIIMCVHEERCNPQLMQLAARDFPLVAVDRRVSGVPVSYVGVDHRQASWDLTKYLFDRGYENICFVSSNSAESSSLKERETGFVDCCMEHGVLMYRLMTDFTSTLLKSKGKENLKRDMQYIRTFIKTHQKADAFIAAEYNTARIIRHTLSELGLDGRYPVVCFDGIRKIVGEHGFTHVEQPELEIGRTCAMVLHEKIKGDSKVEIRLLPYEIVETAEGL